MRNGHLTWRQTNIKKKMKATTVLMVESWADESGVSIKREPFASDVMRVASAPFVAANGWDMSIMSVGTLFDSFASDVMCGHVSGSLEPVDVSFVSVGTLSVASTSAKTAASRIRDISSSHASHSVVDRRRLCIGSFAPPPLATPTASRAESTKCGRSAIAPVDCSGALNCSRQVDAWMLGEKRVDECLFGRLYVVESMVGSRAEMCGDGGSGSMAFACRPVPADC